jgi:ParB family chromosome partitioning protein
VTTSAAENLAGHSDKDKEKVEKRRALGRGLASLLPGPRVVPGMGASGQSGGAFGGQQIPPSGRNDRASNVTTTTGAEAPALKAAHDAAPSAFASGQALKGRSSTEVDTASAEEKPSAGTSEISAHAAVPEVGSTAAVETRAGARAPHEAYEVAYSDPPGDLAGRPASDPRGFQPPYDSTSADGTLTINAQAETRVPSNLVINLAIANINKNPFQTRYVDDDDALQELAESIKANGVVQPIVVRPAAEDGRFILILGERRLHASRKAGKTHIPALVRRVPEQQAAEMTIVENLQREDLSPLEQAEAFRVLSNQFAMTQQQIAERVGLSRTSIANYMRLLKLPREVMQMLAEKRLNFAQAKELLKLGENDRIAEAALYAVKKGMNIEQIEMLVLRMEGLLDPLPDMPGVQKEKRSGGARWVDPNVRAAQIDLERMLGVRVRIRDRKGKGKIVIEYSTVDDYERVVEMLRGKK